MITVKDLKKKFLPGIAPEDFFVLVAHVTGKDKAFLLAHDEYILPDDLEQKALDFLKRRSQDEPVAYIIGYKEFYGRSFLVNKATLIPRPETEHLIETVLSSLKQSSLPLESLDIIDVGTGSGNIIITLANELSYSSLRFFGLDISEEALLIAKENSERLTKKNIIFIKSDLLKEYFSLKKKNSSFLITANLPYLSQEIFAKSARDVTAYEPTSALVSAQAGLSHYYHLLDDIATLRSSDTTGMFFFEISPEQASSLTSSIQSRFPEVTLRTLPDLSGRERLIQGLF